MDIKKIGAIDTVVNIWTPESLTFRPGWRDGFFVDKMNANAKNVKGGVTLEECIRQMDAAGIRRGFLVSTKCGPKGPAATYHLPVRLVAEAIQKYPDRFSGLAGVDPTEGMAGVREFEKAVKEYGFVGAHCYPQWFELAPDQPVEYIKKALGGPSQADYEALKAENDQLRAEVEALKKRLGEQPAAS